MFLKVRQIYKLVTFLTELAVSPALPLSVVKEKQMIQRLVVILKSRCRSVSWFHKAGGRCARFWFGQKPSAIDSRTFVQTPKRDCANMLGESVSYFIGLWTCITQNLKWVTQEDLLYTYSGAIDTYEVYPVQWWYSHAQLGPEASVAMDWSIDIVRSVSYRYGLSCTVLQILQGKTKSCPVAFLVYLIWIHILKIRCFRGRSDIICQRNLFSFNNLSF